MARYDVPTHVNNIDSSSIEWKTLPKCESGIQVFCKYLLLISKEYCDFFMNSWDWIRFESDKSGEADLYGLVPRCDANLDCGYASGERVA